MDPTAPVEYRVVAPDERAHGPALYALLDTVWPGTGAECAAGRIADSHYDWDASRVALAGGEVVGHVGAYGLRLRVGTARVPAAGLNLVATHARHRGGGMAGARCWAHDAMRAQGSALALLCNARPGVYGSAGYRPAWPEHEYAVWPGPSAAAAPPAEALEPFVPDGQPDLAELYNREHATVTGTAVRPTYRHTKMPSCRGTGVLWRDGAGRPAGYLVADVSRDGQTLWHSDSAGDPEQRLRALGALAHAHAPGCAAVRFRGRRTTRRSRRTCAASTAGRRAGTGRTGAGWSASSTPGPCCAPSRPSWRGAWRPRRTRPGAAPCWWRRPGRPWKPRVRPARLRCSRVRAPLPWRGRAGRTPSWRRTPSASWPSAAERRRSWWARAAWSPGGGPDARGVLFPPELPQLGNGDL